MFFMTREDCLYGAMICMLHYFWLIIKGRKNAKQKRTNNKAKKFLQKTNLCGNTNLNKQSRYIHIEFIHPDFFVSKFKWST